MFNEDDENRCLTGVPCLRVATNDTEKVARIFGDFERNVNAGITYNVTCCYGYSIDLMENVANDLDLKFQVYVVADGQCGAKRSSKWDGVIADLRSGAAHLSFAPLSVTSGRSEVIDFSIPFFYSGLSILEATKNDDVPLLAFLKPFGADLWIGIFISLNVTAVAVAIYEWLSPFGLNPWGRQRTKNFSLASALWVMWGLLFSHLVAFKAPKSWPNKFLINVWGGFSVIFLASYTANIAALFTGVFTQNTVTTFQDPRVSQLVTASFPFSVSNRSAEPVSATAVPIISQSIKRNGLPDPSAPPAGLPINCLRVSRSWIGRTKSFVAAQLRPTVVRRFCPLGTVTTISFFLCAVRSHQIRCIWLHLFGRYFGADRGRHTAAAWPMAAGRNRIKDEADS